MNIPTYSIGDLVILKPELWKDDIRRVGVITEMMYQSSFNSELLSFLVVFENVHPLVKNRIVWHADVIEHYPVKK